MTRLKGQKLDTERMITLTAYPEWGDLVDDLSKQIYAEQANGFENAKDFPDLCTRRGYAQGLAYIVNLRDTIKKVAEVEHADL